MIIKSQLYMMPTTEFFPGQCSLCGHRAVIKFRDRSTGWQLGDCCLSFVLAAERALVTSGASHPTPKHHENTMRMIDITDLPLPRDRTAEEREAEAALLNSGNKAPVGIRSQIAALVHEIDFAGDIIFSIETALADMRARQTDRLDKLNRLTALITRHLAPTPPRPASASGHHYFGIEYEFGGRRFTTVVSAPNHEIAMREFRRLNPEVNLITIGEHQ